jgi:hypothetical protein
MLARSGLKLGHHQSSQPTKFLARNLKTAKAKPADKERIVNEAVNALAKSITDQGLSDRRFRRSF